MSVERQCLQLQTGRFSSPNSPCPQRRVSAPFGNDVAMPQDDAVCRRARLQRSDGIRDGSPAIPSGMVTRQVAHIDSRAELRGKFRLGGDGEIDCGLESRRVETFLLGVCTSQPSPGRRQVNRPPVPMWPRAMREREQSTAVKCGSSSSNRPALRKIELRGEPVYSAKSQTAGRHSLAYCSAEHEGMGAFG